ncbi:MAG: 2-dehydro-3-deoxy-D-gluconate 5-dehydrogenase [Hyphomicrobiales bacterium]|jgi:2-deoxy-D-gluconate 3-dehydrogenase|nr:2-dehydro-3-deoxy-D-gluconate 5-dehydrogenase [Hyphomicrobiales bacterium]
MALFDLTAKTAIVTGASSGIGQAIAVALAQAGARVAGVARSPQEETAARVRDAGGDYLAIQADLASIEPVERILDETVRWAGQADILINNAGILRRADPLEFSEKDWDDVVNVDLKSVFFLAQAFAKRALARGGGGKIINVASILAYVGGIRVPSYTASKHGVAGLTKLLANEWAAKGINVNAIAPGYVRTDATQALQDDPVRSERLLSRIPAGRWGEPEDIGGAAVFLASGASNYCHGTILVVDGGWLAG